MTRFLFKRGKVLRAVPTVGLVLVILGGIAAISAAPSPEALKWLDERYVRQGQPNSISSSMLSPELQALLADLGARIAVLEQQPPGTPTPSPGVVVEDGEDGWDVNTNVTGAIDATDKKAGAYSVKLDIADAFTAPGDIASEAIGNMDLNGYSHITMWIKVSAGIPAGGTITFAMYNTPTATWYYWNMPALSPNVWTQVQLALGTYARTGITQVGLRSWLDPGAITIRVDDIRAIP